MQRFDHGVGIGNSMGAICSGTLHVAGAPVGVHGRSEHSLQALSSADGGAAEVSRLEQRLAALGKTVGQAEQLLAQDPTSERFTAARNDATNRRARVNVVDAANAEREAQHRNPFLRHPHPN